MDYDDFNSVSPPFDSRAPADRLERNPMITKEGFENFLRLKQHPNAPVWNFETGDRIEAADVADVDSFRESLKTSRIPAKNAPAPHVLHWLANMRPRVTAFRDRLSQGLDLERDWAQIPPAAREDVAVRIESLVPVDADLDRLIVFDTSGTTGHALAVPTHPAALGKVLAMIEFVLKRYGLEARFVPDATACLNVGVQACAVVFPNVLSLWNQAGFAKLNLNPDDWRDPSDLGSFVESTAPLLITGDPAAFAQLARREVHTSPAAMLTTALKLSGAVKEKTSAAFSCPVIDWYSTTETGPVGYACPLDCGFHILPHDIFVEIIDDQGYPVPEGQTGEIAVTGGRNPFLPLLRYRTGDKGAMDFSPCPCGDPMPRVVGLDGRDAVLFFADGDKSVNPVDIGRLLRNFPMLQHRFVQQEDGSCDLSIRPATMERPPDTETMREKLAMLFGENTSVRIRLEPELGEKMWDGDLAVYENKGWRP